MRDAAALLAVVLAAVWLVGPPTASLRDGVIYVSPDGADWQTGRSPESAVRTIQRAADLVAPGEEVVILPGTYREWLRVRRGGEPGRPVVFRAAEPGTVTITGDADPSVVDALEWREEGGGVFSAAVPWPVYRVRVEGRDAYHAAWSRPPGVRRLAAREGAWDVSTWVREEGRLYLYVRGGLSPDEARVALHGPIPSPREWGNVRASNVWLEADHVVLDGLRIRGGVGAGVLLWDADHVEIRESFFEGADFGVQTRPTVDPATDLVVAQNLYHNYPQADWRRSGWLTWDQVYAHYAASTLLASREGGVRVRGNLVLHAGDALRLTNGGEGTAGVEATENVIYGATDDAFELDGPSRDVTLRRNLVFDAHESLSLSPVTHGPALVEHNLFLHPAGGLNGAQLKLLNPWYRSVPDLVIRNATVRRNTFVGEWLAWWNSRMPVEDVDLIRNVFLVQYATDPPLPPGVRARSNVVTFVEGGVAEPGLDPRRWNGTATDAGLPVGAAPDGEAWSIPRPGPRWFDLEGHPASRELSRRLTPELIGG